MSDQLIATLNDQVKDARRESEKRRKRNGELNSQIAKLTADLAAANQKATDLETKLGKMPSEQQDRINDLTGQLRTFKHKAAFKEAAINAGVRPNAVDTAWAAMAMKSDTDEPDVDAIEAALADAKDRFDFLFGNPTTNGVRDLDDPALPPAKPALGGARGSRVGSGVFRVTESQQADPAWCEANDKRLREAQANGTLQIVAG